MGKTTGFKEFERQNKPDRPVEGRLQDWDAVAGHLPDEVLHTQAARCMDCGVPFCHTGTMVNGMASGCPIHNLIPEWNDLVYRGRWREAYDRLRRTNNFPEFTSMVCPAPCEASCTLGVINPPVTIKSIEHAIIDRAYAEGWVDSAAPERRTGKKVAVVGSGPSGLACADQLNSAGHMVTVFERDDRPGGLLMYGIPNMKLPKEIVERRVRLMEEAGIRFLTGVAVGKDVPAEKLRTDFDAIVLCIGAGRPRDLETPGRQWRGIHFALDYLKPNTRSLLDSNLADGAYLSAAGKDVIVIGGGDTGTDCVATALRHGCRSVAQFELLPRPPDRRTADNPWPQWPRIHRTDYGQEEAAARFGADPRTFSILTKEFLDDGSGNLAGIRTVQVEWTSNGNGRPAMKEIPGTEKTWPAQMALLALGYLGPEEFLLKDLQVEQDARSNILAKMHEFTTSIPGVFAAGDSRRGQSLIVWAIHEGRGAARAVDEYLMGSSDLPR